MKVEFTARVEYDEKPCPTPCDDPSCGERCHETHQPPAERTHEPGKCRWLNGHLILIPLDGRGRICFYLRHVLGMIEKVPAGTQVRVVWDRKGDGEYGFTMTPVLGTGGDEQ